MTVAELLAEARRELDRLEPEAAADALRHGELLIDIRTLTQQAAHGVIPGAVPIDRTVLEWRLDPDSPDHIPQIDGYDGRVILICNEGYASSLAAAELRRMGVTRATDVIGGVQAWAANGLPLVPLAGG
jgi:rhodanese-related sulfurtransferase